MPRVCEGECGTAECTLLPMPLPLLASGMTEREGERETQRESVEPPDLHTKCQRCHRGLKTIKSRLRGYGPVCWAMVQMETPADEPGEQQPA